MDDKAARTADYLAELWRRGETIPALPPDLAVATEVEAQAVQRAFLLRHQSCGWKVGGRPGGGDGWCAAPLRGAPHAGTGLALASRLAAEIEVGFVLAAPLPAGSDRSMALGAVGSVNLMIELFGSRYADPTVHPFATILADNLNNAGVVIGTGVPLALAPPLDSLAISFEHEGETIGQATSGPDLDTLADALIWLADYALALGRPLGAGDVIICGARIGPSVLHRPGRYAARSALGTALLRVET